MLFTFFSRSIFLSAFIETISAVSCVDSVHVSLSPLNKFFELCIYLGPEYKAQLAGLGIEILTALSRFENEQPVWYSFCDKENIHEQICICSKCIEIESLTLHREIERKNGKQRREIRRVKNKTHSALFRTQCISTLNKIKTIYFTLFYYFWYIYITSW